MMNISKVAKHNSHEDKFADLVEYIFQEANDQGIYISNEDTLRAAKHLIPYYDTPGVWDLSFGVYDNRKIVVTKLRIIGKR